MPSADSDRPMKNRLLRTLSWLAWFPVRLMELLETGFRWAAKNEWYRAGFACATAACGPLGLRAYRAKRPGRAARWMLRGLAWILCLAGLAWFGWWGWCALFLIPLLRQGRRLSAAPEEEEPAWARRSLLVRPDRLDAVTLGLIAALAAVLWLTRSGFVPFPPDGYHHLLIARDIVREGRLPVWASWELAPLGRPQLYPPGIHLLIAALSLPFQGDVLEGFRALQALLLPAVHLSTWYLARWLFDSRRAFCAVLLVGMDIPFTFMGLMGLPSLLANAVIAVMLVCFLSERVILAGLLGALALHLHTGVAVLAFLGLAIFALTRRRYAAPLVATAALAGILAAPWYAFVWEFRDWFHHPIESGMRGHFGPIEGRLFKLIWMQMVNIPMVLLVLRAWRLSPRRGARHALMRGQLLGFLPMLLSYGGRYFSHTLQIWMVIAAGLLAPFLKPPLRPRLVAFFLLLALCPTMVVITGWRPLFKPGVYPMISGWLVAPSAGLARQVAGGSRMFFPMWDEAVELAAYIKEHTEPDQVLHISALNGPQFATMVGFLADRPVDTAVYEEVWPPEQMRRLLRWSIQHDTRGCFVVAQSGFVDAPRTEREGADRQWVRVGPFSIHIPAGKNPAPGS